MKVPVIVSIPFIGSLLWEVSLTLPSAIYFGITTETIGPRVVLYMSSEERKDMTLDTTPFWEDGLVYRAVIFPFKISFHFPSVFMFPGTMDYDVI